MSAPQTPAGAHAQTQARGGTARKVGRPVDEGAEERILDAGLRLYGSLGFRGMTMTAIAFKASVGKSALYSRFEGPEEILAKAFERFVPELTGPFTSIREVLVAECNRMASLYMGDYALAVQRITVDAATGDPFEQITAAMAERTVLPMRAYVREAIESGELPPWTKATLLLDVIEGAVRMHTTAFPHLLDAIKPKVGSYIEQLVDEQLLLLEHVGEMRGHPDATPDAKSWAMPRARRPRRRHPATPRRKDHLR